MDDVSLYIIEDAAGLLKVGISKNPSGRLRYFKTGNPSPMKVVATRTYPSRIHAQVVEKRAHSKLRACSVAGEWFKCSPDAALKIIDDAEQGVETEVRLGPMTDFARWVAHMKTDRHWSARECARQLGCGINQISRWSENGAPPYIGLACAALSYGLPAWRKL